MDRTLTTDELQELMDKFSVPAGRIYTAAEMMVCEHYAAREALVKVEHETFQNLYMQNVFPKLSENARRREVAPASRWEPTTKRSTVSFSDTDPRSARIGGKPGRFEILSSPREWRAGGRFTQLFTVRFGTH